MTYTVAALDPTGMACRVTSTAAARRLLAGHRLPHRPAAQLRGDAPATRLQGPGSLKLFVRYDATVNGNGGGGPANGGADDATVDPATTALVSSDTNTVTNAVNRDYGVPTVRRAAGRPAVPVRDQRLRRHRVRRADPARRRPHARPDHAVGAAGQRRADRAVDRRGNSPITLALGYGSTAAAAIGTAGSSAGRRSTPPWPGTPPAGSRYDARLQRPPLRSARPVRGADPARWPSSTTSASTW